MKKLHFIFLVVALTGGDLLAANYYSYFPLSVTYVSVRADKVEYEWGEKKIYLSGNVKVTMGDLTIRAESIYLDKKIGVLEAEGSVTLSGPGFFVSGNNIYVNIRTRRIQMGKVVVIFPEEKIRLKGEKLNIKGKSVYVENACFTPCECGEGTPFWGVEGKKIRFTIGGYVWITGGGVKFFGKRVFYLPFLIFPAKYERETGFLFPSLSYSKLRGFEFHLPFYINISPWSEGLIQLDYYSIAGFGLTGEFRYIISRKNRGSLMLTSLFKNGSDFVEFRGSHTYSGGGSDLNLNIDLALHPEKRIDLVDDSRIEGERYLTSSIEGERRFKAGTIYGNLTFYQYIRKSEFLFLPAGGFFSRPFYTGVMDGILWVRSDLPEGNFDNRRFLLGWELYRNFKIFRYISVNIENQSLTRLKGDSLSSAGVLKIFGSTFIEGKIGKVNHTIDLTGGYRWTGGDIVSSYDGWDTPYYSKGLFFRWKDNFTCANISIEYDKLFFLSDENLIYNRFSLQNGPFILKGSFTLYGKKVSDVAGKVVLKSPAGSLESGVLLRAGNDEIRKGVESFIFNNSGFENSNFSGTDQIFVSFTRTFGRFVAGVSGRWMLDNNEIFQDGFFISYHDRCGCFSAKFSFQNWPYKHRSTWSFEFSFGKFGSITF